jgi:hypothetical protein
MDDTSEDDEEASAPPIDYRVKTLPLCDDKCRQG